MLDSIIGVIGMMEDPKLQSEDHGSSLTLLCILVSSLLMGGINPQFLFPTEEFSKYLLCIEISGRAAYTCYFCFLIQHRRAMCLCPQGDPYAAIE